MKATNLEVLVAGLLAHGAKGNAQLQRRDDSIAILIEECKGLLELGSLVFIHVIGLAHGIALGHGCGVL